MLRFLKGVGRTAGRWVLGLFNKSQVRSNLKTLPVFCLFLNTKLINMIYKNSARTVLVNRLTRFSGFVKGQFLTAENLMPSQKRPWFMEFIPPFTHSSVKLFSSSTLGLHYIPRIFKIYN